MRRPQTRQSLPPAPPHLHPRNATKPAGSTAQHGNGAGNFATAPGPPHARSHFGRPFRTLETPPSRHGAAEHAHRARTARLRRRLRRPTPRSASRPRSRASSASAQRIQMSTSHLSRPSTVSPSAWYGVLAYAWHLLAAVALVPAATFSWRPGPGGAPGPPPAALAARLAAFFFARRRRRRRRRGRVLAPAGRRAQPLGQRVGRDGRAPRGERVRPRRLCRRGRAVLAPGSPPPRRRRTGRRLPPDPPAAPAEPLGSGCLLRLPRRAARTRRWSSPMRPPAAARTPAGSPRARRRPRARTTASARARARARCCCACAQTRRATRTSRSRSRRCRPRGATPLSWTWTRGRGVEEEFWAPWPAPGARRRPRGQTIISLHPSPHRI